MFKKDIKKLAQVSYTNDNFDEEKVEKISNLLRKKDLKEYIRALKLIEKQKEIIVALPDIKSYNKSDNFFEKLFIKKRIIYQDEPSLFLGLRITDNDMVYDINLKSRLEEAARTIEQNYE